MKPPNELRLLEYFCALHGILHSPFTLYNRRVGRLFLRKAPISHCALESAARVKSPKLGQKAQILFLPCFTTQILFAVNSKTSRSSSFSVPTTIHCNPFILRYSQETTMPDFTCCNLHFLSNTLEMALLISTCVVKTATNSDLHVI